jgi:hypothetical protein
MSATPAGTQRGRLECSAGDIDTQIAPAILRDLETAASRQQRAAHRLQAGYLLVLLAAPLVRLVPIPGSDRSRFDGTAAALLLIAAVGMRLLLRRVAADSDWVRARRESESLRAAAWRRCVSGRPTPEDGPLSHRIGGTDVASRWRFYRRYRIDAQIGYFADRAARHGRLAGRWQRVRLLLTLGTLVVAAASLVVPVPAGMIGLVAALLATSEAWLQFRRSEVLARSFAEAGDELSGLREQEPADEAALTQAVDSVELVLERERWTWTAIMSVAVLTSSGWSFGRPSASRTGGGR